MTMELLTLLYCLFVKIFSNPNLLQQGNNIVIARIEANEKFKEFKFSTL